MQPDKVRLEFIVNKPKTSTTEPTGMVPMPEDVAPSGIVMVEAKQHDGVDTFTVTANVCVADVPQLLLAVTVMFPLAPLAVVVIEFVVEVPVQPPGNVHV